MCRLRLVLLQILAQLVVGISASEVRGVKREAVHQQEYVSRRHLVNCLHSKC